MFNPHAEMFVLQNSMNNLMYLDLILNQVNLSRRLTGRILSIAVDDNDCIWIIFPHGEIFHYNITFYINDWVIELLTCYCLKLQILFTSLWRAPIKI